MASAGYLTRPVDHNLEGLRFDDDGTVASVSRATPLPVQDYAVEALLAETVKQLRIMNLHLSMLTDTMIDKKDLPTEIQ